MFSNEKSSSSSSFLFQSSSQGGLQENYPYQNLQFYHQYIQILFYPLYHQLILLLLNDWFCFNLTNVLQKVLHVLILNYFCLGHHFHIILNITFIDLMLLQQVLYQLYLLSKLLVTKWAWKRFHPRVEQFVSPQVPFSRDCL